MRIGIAAIGKVLAFASLCLLAGAASAARADPIGLYIGAGVGQADVPVDQFAFYENHSGYKVLVGLRPIPVVGAELEYVDFGHPATTPAAGTSADAAVRGSALYGILYLPLPVPTVDLYAKVGLSRLQTTATVSQGAVALFRLEQTDTRAAFGAGAQVTMSSLALRAEFERFSSASGKPRFWSLAGTWSF